MKAILEFNLPDDNEDWKLYIKAAAMSSAIWDYSQWLRQICKYGEPDKVNAQKCRDKFIECMKDHEIEI